MARIAKGEMTVRILRAVLILIALAGPGVQAQDASREQAIRELAAADVQTRRHAIVRLAEVGMMADVPQLLEALRDPDIDTRREAERAIWRIWSRSGDPEVDMLYQSGIEQMESGDLRQAIETFTRVIQVKPDFAEGWNKRATLYFLVGELRKSLADCDEVIKRNPHHFGALAGYAQIYARLEAYERALEYSRLALRVNPNLIGMRRNIELLEQVIEERRQKSA